MQTKSKSITEPSTHERVVFSAKHPEVAPFPDWEIDIYVPSYSPKYEIMTPNSGGGRRAWKHFEHFKTQTAAPPTTGGMQLESENGAFYPNHAVGIARNPLVGYHREWWGTWQDKYGDAGRLDNGLPAFIVPRADGGFVPPPSDLDGLKQRAMRAMLPSIKAELSLPNSILELKDFKRPLQDLVARARKSWNSIPHFRAYLPQDLSPGEVTRFIVNARLTMREALKKLRSTKPKNVSEKLARKTASSYLGYKFAVLPFLSDVAAVKRAMLLTTKRVNDLIARVGRRQSRHFTYVWKEFEDTSDEGDIAGYWDWREANRITIMQNLYCQRTCLNEATRFHAQLEYNYNYTEHQLANAQLYGHLDALGVNLNPAIIWNAIPFSFVLDWVVNVGDFLDRWKVENMKPTINIHRFLWSVLRKRRILVTKGVQGLFPGVASYRNQLPVVYQEAYRRSPDTPDSSSILTSGLSSEEFTLGAAMVIASGRRRSN